MKLEGALWALICVCLFVISFCRAYLRQKRSLINIIYNFMHPLTATLYLYNHTHTLSYPPLNSSVRFGISPFFPFGIYKKIYLTDANDRTQFKSTACNNVFVLFYLWRFSIFSSTQGKGRRQKSFCLLWAFFFPLGKARQRPASSEVIILLVGFFAFFSCSTLVSDLEHRTFRRILFTSFPRLNKTKRTVLNRSHIYKFSSTSTSHLKLSLSFFFCFLRTTVQTGI